jgi:hypothetical protein
LPVLRDFLGGFSWVCSRTFAGLWYGPVWTANIYRSAMDVPPNPAIGGCPRPCDESRAQPPEAEQAAATAVHLSQLATGELKTLYSWLHPDAQAAVPESAVVGWYAEEWIPLGPDPIVVSTVDFVPWTWGVTGVTYPRAARIAFEQSFADGTVAGGVTYLVRDDTGVWRWFFGPDAAFIAAQLDRFAPPGSGASRVPPRTRPDPSRASGPTQAAVTLSEQISATGNGDSWNRHAGLPGSGRHVPDSFEKRGG